MGIARAAAMEAAHRAESGFYEVLSSKFFATVRYGVFRVVSRSAEIATARVRAQLVANP